ncbi:GNAT family N-acetyltransferase [Deinococcus sp. Arct2-2]|uniref:GNAT family N-acetyltransferase n=1 Tax=Deinococcus sp. Arct2-2 TaxID=2568653 RepID=UPI001F0FB23B|nr:GNAT family N-acetyltransferase [Deinococcus sp. Arct2-2]
MPEFLICPARYDDLAEVQTLYKHLSPSSPELSTEAANHVWWELLADPKMHVLVAEQDGVWGTVTLVVMPNLTQGGRPHALSENVVTHSEKRGEGIGR